MLGGLGRVLSPCSRCLYLTGIGRDWGVSKPLRLGAPSRQKFKTVDGQGMQERRKPRKKGVNLSVRRRCSQESDDAQSAWIFVYRNRTTLQLRMGSTLVRTVAQGDNRTRGVEDRGVHRTKEPGPVRQVFGDMTGRGEMWWEGIMTLA